MNKKVILGIFIALILIAGILLTKNTNSSIHNTFPQGIIPTSTSAPTPTSLYGAGNQNQQEVTPNPADTVTLTANGFIPQVLTIKAGDTVTWVNNSGVQATVNSDPHPLHTAYPPLNLGEFNDGDSLSLTFPKPGRYGYHNHLDATQTGIIIVK